MRQAESALPLEHALALGLLHGPAELLPVSSSAHTTLIPWLVGWPYALGHMNVRRAAVLTLALAPPTLTGYLLGGTIERRLGGPRSIAAGLIAGSLAMAVADVRAGGRGEGERSSEDAEPGDGLALGLAQASALMPGVSRSGATLSAARARGFSRRAAQGLSWEAGLPVILGACLLKGLRLRRVGVRREHRAALAAGGVAAFVSTLVSVRALRRGTRDGRSLLPYSFYRCLLAALVIARMRAQ
jgi:undecaprenyl-diphosphatase